MRSYFFDFFSRIHWQADALSYYRHVDTGIETFLLSSMSAAPAGKFVRRLDFFVAGAWCVSHSVEIVPQREQRLLGLPPTTLFTCVCSDAPFFFGSCVVLKKETIALRLQNNPSVTSTLCKIALESRHHLVDRVKDNTGD